MDKYSKRSIARLWIALAVLMALCTTTETFAQTSAATDSISATTTAVIATLEETTVESSAPSTVGELVNGLNTVWMLLAAMLVFFMQPGFALVEAGFTRVKNTANILMKNFVDFMFGSLLYWFIGFGLMFGVGGFVGMPHFFNLSFYDGGGLPTEGFLVFQTVFCATAATIVSGAMAERTKFSMYLIYTIFISVLIYPISGHWTWGGGWLMNGEEGSFMMNLFGTTFHDFAGSTIVHSVGGWIALVGAAILGPRIGKYSKDGKSRAIPGHNLTMAGTGCIHFMVRLVRIQPRFTVGSSLYGRCNGYLTRLPHHESCSLCRRFLRAGGQLVKIQQTIFILDSEWYPGRFGRYHGRL